MRLKQYIKEGKISEDEWQKRFDKISKTYNRIYKQTINKMIKSKDDQYYHYRSWDDILETAGENVKINHINDQFTTKWLNDFEASLEAILSTANDDL
jgi:predicted alpha/beta hydrolase family esterase